MMEPGARVWRVIEHGDPKTYWVAKGVGDEAGWRALAEKCPDRFSIEYCDLVPQSALSDAEARIAELERKLRAETFRADTNDRFMKDHFEASAAKSVEIQNLKAYITKTAKEVAETIDQIRKRDVSVEQRARAEAAEARNAELEAQLDEALKGNVVPSSLWLEQVEKTRAAEALLKEAGPIIETFAQIGDYVLAEAPADATMWYAGHSCTGEHMAQVSLDYFRAARAIRDKIGAKDE